MAKLDVPVESGSSNLQPMSIQGVAEQTASAAKIGAVEQGQGADAIAGAASIGSQEQNFGSWLSQYGGESAKQGLKAMNDSLYNIVQSNAATAYNTAAAKHVASEAQPSSDGSINYLKASKFKQPGALSNDLDQISKDVQAKYITGLQDPQSKQKFTDAMTGLNDNHKILANGVQRNAQGDIAGKALSQALDSDIQSGLVDSPENLGYYAHQGISRISDALEAGSITAQQAAALGDNLRKNLYFGSLSVQNQKDPNSIGQLLQSKTPQDLNLTQIEYDTLVKQNQFAKHDADILSKTQYQASNEISAAKSSFEFGSLSSGLKAGTVNSTQVMQAYDQGKISFTQLSQLANIHQSETQKANNTWQTRSNLSADMDTGRVLSDYTDKQIDDHYTNRVKSISNDGSMNLDLMKKADIAAQYKGPVNNIAREIQYSIESGDPSKLKDGVAAFNKLQETNPLVLSGVTDQKFLAYASALTDAYKYTTSMDKSSIQKIHDSIYNVDGRTQTSRANQFSKESAFSQDNIRTTIANMYEGGNGWIQGKDGVSDDTVAMLEPLFRQAYNQTGDKNAAIEMVKNQTKALVGHSAVNDTPRWGLDGGSIMALPPEKVYGNKASASEIRQLVNHEIAPILPKGVSPDQVMLGSDDKTIAEARYKDANGKSIPPSYYLYYMDENGHEVLLPKRWALDSVSDAKLKDSRAGIANTGQDVKTAPTPVPGLKMTDMDYKLALSDALQSTKGFGDPDKPIINEDFINKAADSSYIPQIVSHYPGDPQQKPVVISALNSMIGADKDSWRVAQSLKLVNSVLTNNAAPATYLKYGMSTMQPNAGDIVVSNTRAGLFGGMQNVNGQPMVKMVSMVNGQLQVNVIDPKEVKGYRSLPTPENFSKQDEPISIKPAVQQLDIYGTGNGAARVGTGQERFNPYNMTTSIEPTNKENKPQVYDVNSNSLVSQDSDFKSQLQAAIDKSKTSKGSGVVTNTASVNSSSGNSSSGQEASTNSNGTNSFIPVEQSQSNKYVSDYKGNLNVSNSGSGDQSPGGYLGADKGIEGKQIKLKGGKSDTVVGYENGKIRLKSGKLVRPEDIIGGL